MYAYKTDKFSPVLGNDTKAVKHQLMLGTEYSLKPSPVIPAYIKNIKTFAEVATTRTKHYTNGNKTGKSRDNAVAVGLRLFW